MVDAALRQRIDILVLLLGGWAFLSLVVASFAVMALNVLAGVLALTVVVLVTVVGSVSYLRAGR
ncbi:hypothetical protein [Haloarcula onubensis]|uniref:Uncharacterized protein n=1 Tax=Haloarcula onubensis TaxID=2950539 RepID=A0ABU2FNG3_9EURY|nr:hypothetical protein [Halomicroarcula sp. S3CR25-11]MDS0281837.1 hypothetical protein [Halomicroarcula sp. S3CR25-11]